MKKQLLSALLAGCLVVGCIGPVSASAGNIPPPAREEGTSTVPVVLSQEALAFSVTVPTSIPVYVDNKGNVTFPDSIDIVNNTVAPIEIRDIEITGKNGWTKTENTDGWQADDKKFIMTLDYEGDQVTNWTFAVPPQTSNIIKSEIADVVFTVGWA